MHEFTVCESIVKTLLSEYDAQHFDQNACKVRRVRLAVGELHQIVPESIEMAYEALTVETPLVGSYLELRQIPLSIQCSACGWEGTIKPPFFICPGCQSHEVVVMTGRELYIEDMEIETDEQADGQSL